MRDAIKGGARLELSDGRVLTLEYDFDGMIALEEASGMKMPELYKELARLERAKESPSLRIQRAIFYGGLQAHHPDITLKEVGHIILSEADALEEAFKALSGAHGPAEAGEPGANPPKRGAGNGGSSSKAGRGQGSTPTVSDDRPLTPTPVA
jgi:hypothetical protein